MRTASSMGELYELVDTIPCPTCEATELEVTLRQEANEMWPWIVCRACGFEEKGHRD
jgi:uncharacterized protein YbaR (Trm112 family)